MEETFKKTIGQDVRPNANKINVPTLLIYGSGDRETPVSDGHLLNRAIKNSRLEVVEAGHFLHQDQPQKVARLIRNFLEG